ncbi:TraR/DksA family transcriptional regulator [Candidatus Nitrospira bockiana]
MGDVLTDRRPAARAANPKYDEILYDLQRQRAEVLRLVASKPLSSGIEVEVFPDLNDQATAEIDQHFMLSLKERDRNLLKQIDEALDRMARDRYGICESCGEDIPLRRLKARPMTTLCVECKTLQEEEDRIRH